MKIAFIGGDVLWLLGVIDDILSQPDVFTTPELVFMDRLRALIVADS